jgi:hypothetical protein
MRTEARICSVNWQVRTYTWPKIFLYALWSANRNYEVPFRGLSFETPVSCMDDRISNGEKPIMAYGRVLASGKRLARMVDLSRQHGSRRPLLLRGAVLCGSGCLVFLLGSSVPKSEQRPLRRFCGPGSADERHSVIADPLRACRSDDDAAISVLISAMFHCRSQQSSPPP